MNCAAAKDFGIQVQQEDTLNLPTRDSKETSPWISFQSRPEGNSISHCSSRSDSWGNLQLITERSSVSKWSEKLDLWMSLQSNLGLVGIPGESSHIEVRRGF